MKLTPAAQKAACEARRARCPASRVQDLRGVCDKRCRNPPPSFAVTTRGVSQRAVGAICASPVRPRAACSRPFLRQAASELLRTGVDLTLEVQHEVRAAAAAAAPLLRGGAGISAASISPPFFPTARGAPRLSKKSGKTMGEMNSPQCLLTVARPRLGEVLLSLRPRRPRQEENDSTPRFPR